MLKDDLTQLPDIFKDGIHGLLLMLRNKDGGKGNTQRKSIKLISNGIEDWNDKVAQLLHLQSTIYPNYRLYTSVNARDLRKSIHEFKRRQLDADLADIIAYNEFYLDVKNRFFSALMNPQCRDTSYFLIDCDTQEEYAKARDKIPQELILVDYPTRNGRHLVTQPFNPNEIKVDVKKDDLIFIG